MNKKYSYEYKTKSSVPSFLLKTYEMLENNSPFSKIISWKEDGKSFVIKDMNAFC